MPTDIGPRVKRSEVMNALASHLYDTYRKAHVNNTNKGLAAIAAELVLFMEADILQKDVTPLLLNVKSPMVGTVKLATDPEHTAHWLDESGQFKSSMDTPSMSTLPIKLVTCAPRVNILDLQRGQIGPLEEQVNVAEEAIFKLLNIYAIGLVSAACPAANKVSVATTLTVAAMSAAVAILEDLDQTVKLFFGRASDFADIVSDASAGNAVRTSMQTKGVQSIEIGGANLAYCSQATAGQILLICDKKPGVRVDEFKLQRLGEKENYSKDRLEVEINLYMTTRMGIGHANRIGGITIT